MAILVNAPLILVLLGLFWQNQVSAQCSQNNECMTGGTCFIMSGCTKGTCTCPAGQNVDYTVAPPYACVVPTLTVGTSCTNGANCFTNYCSPTSFKCDCATGVASTDKKSCVNVALNGACIQASDCGSMTSCTNNVCVCQTGLVAAANNVDCTPYFKGQMCNSTSSQCSYSNMGKADSWGSCSTGTCTCLTGSVAYTYSYGGQSATYCVPSSAQVNLPAGSKCSLDTSTASPLLLCASNFACAVCPEAPSAQNASCISPTPCISMPCQNGGTCTAITGTTYSCTCPASYTGTNCQTCQGSTCVTAAVTTVQTGSVGSTVLPSVVFLLSIILLQLF